MNRFRTKKKSKDNGDEVGRTSNESEVPSLPTMKPSMTFRRKKGKEEPPPPKMELDLAHALPASDDFRTSLLMTGLSARFSMLREQDDPKSKIGKASDDSVLFPNRQSRMNDFGFNPKNLADIAEVGSINESIRRPFALDRGDSFHSAEGYVTDTDGSIMSRGKPAEGNNLFGGRQKIYKIPNSGSASSKNLNAAGASAGLGHRAVYDDDLGQSAFQKLRERERDEKEREREEKERQDLSSYNDESRDLPSSNRPESPPLSGYNRNRETSSTTSSGPYGTGSSTAATSFISQHTPSANGHSAPSTPAVPNGPGLERAFTKTKRLYENGLDQRLHTQQSSAVSRLDSLTRQGRNLRTRSPSPGPESPDALPSDPSQQQFPNSTRQGRLPPTNLQSPQGGFDFGVKPSTQDALRPYGITPPLSPPVSEGDDKSAMPIQPNDNGKATSLGTFSKPVHAYDERKYTQRQLQMQQGRETPGRETPPLRKHSPPQAFLPNAANASSQPSASRDRAESNSTYSSARSRSSSSAQREFVSRERMLPPIRDQAPDSQQPSTGTFFSSPNDSDATSPRASEQETCKLNAWEQASAYDEFHASIPAPLSKLARPLQPEHPAFRQEDAEAPSIKVSKAPGAIITGGLREVGPPQDSPTLPPISGLSGIIRQHLRSESNTSSIGGASSPGLGSSDFTTNDNPWDGNDWDRASGAESKPIMPTSNTKQSSTAPSSGFQSKQATPRAVSEASDTSSWDKETSLRHSRDRSTESQRERDDFANELAARRKRVQENLRSFAESDSRSQSPVPGAAMESPNESSFAKNGHLNFLKSKASKTAMGARHKEAAAPVTQQSKAMKMFGINGSASGSSTPATSSQRQEDNRWKQEEEEMLRGVLQSATSPPGTKQFRDRRRDAQRERERQVIMRHRQGAGLDSGDSDDYSRRSKEHGPPYMRGDVGRGQHPAMRTRSPSRDTPPVSYRAPRAPSEDSRNSTAANSRPGTRDRSSSGGSGRSRSRSGRYRDDRGVPEGLGIAAHANLPMMGAPGLPPTGAVPPLPSPRPRSTSKPQAFPGYFDHQPSQPTHDPPAIGTGLPPRRSPAAPPYAVNSTPVLSPVSPLGSISASAPPPQPAQGAATRFPPNRKRSVNKSDISEPTLVSTTSRISTVHLPASGATAAAPPQPAAPPPLPPMDPRRRQTTRQGMFGAWKSSRRDDASAPTSPTYPPVSQQYAHAYDDTSTFSGDEADQQPHAQRAPRGKLRKSSSEGGNMNARARAAFAAQPSPAVPAFPAGARALGGMF